MSDYTAVVTVKEMQGDDGGLPVAHIRRASFGEPTKLLPDLFKALPYSKPLGTYHAGTFAAGMIAAWATLGAPWVSLASDFNGQEAGWRYEVTKAKHGKHMVVRVYRWCDGSTRKGVRQGWFEVFYGIWREAVLFSDLIEQAGYAKPMVKIEARTAEPSFQGVKAALGVEGVQIEDHGRDGPERFLVFINAAVAMTRVATLNEAFKLGRQMAKDREAFLVNREKAKASGAWAKLTRPEENFD